VGSRSGKKDEEGGESFRTKRKDQDQERGERKLRKQYLYIQFVVFLISLLRVKSNVASKSSLYKLELFIRSLNSIILDKSLWVAGNMTDLSYICVKGLGIVLPISPPSVPI
jgi:hypothetical protein